jgi:hypothetical protein
MSCPLNAKRWAGSGYVKCESTAASKEADERMLKMIAEREAQDTRYFPQSKPVTQTLVQNGSNPKAIQS